jgi:cytochrome c
MSDGDEMAYKEFRYPDGKVLRHTKQDFQAIVEYFIWLDRQATKLRAEGKIPCED